MKRSILVYGLIAALALLLLKLLEYRFFARQISLEIFVAIIALLFTAMGIWVGLKAKKPAVVIAPDELATFKLDDARLEDLGISEREYEVLGLMAQGHSNQEIADALFISLNTVKTHSSNLFQKLNVQRRTQAVKRAQELRLLP